MRRRDGILLATIVLAAAAAATVFAWQLTEFVIFPDELGYVKQATMLSHGDLVRPGSIWFNSWAQLYPALLAPLVRALSATGAFDGGHALGALLMASTAIPAFLLARLVLGRSVAALAAAALVVSVPWLAMSGSFMTEVLAYPLFAWAALAATHAAARPTARNDALLLAALAAAFLARTQMVVLVPASVVAVVVVGALREQGRPPARRVLDAIRLHALLLGALALAALALLASGTNVLGTYSATTEGKLFEPQTLAFARETVAYVVVAAGIIPLTAGSAWMALTAARPRTTSADAHAFAWVGLLFCIAIAGVGGSFTAKFGGGINERYVFYVVVPLMIAMVAGLLERPRGWRPALATTGALTTWLVAASRFAQEGPSLLTPSTALHTALSSAAGAIGLTTAGLMAIATAIAVAALVAIPARVPAWRTAAVAIGAVFAFCAYGTGYTYAKIAATQAGTSPAFVARRGWLDRALPAEARSAIVLTSFGSRGATAADWWDTAFWNKTVLGVYRLPDADAFELHTSELVVDPRTGRVPQLDGYDYFVRGGFDTRISLAGSTTAASSGGFLIVKAERPYRAEWLMTGGDPDTGLILPGRTASIRAWRAPGRAGARLVGVTLQALDEARAPQRIRLSAPGSKTTSVTLPPRSRTTFDLRAVYTRDGCTDLRVRPSGPDAVRLIAIAQP